MIQRRVPLALRTGRETFRGRNPFRSLHKILVIFFPEANLRRPELCEGSLCFMAGGKMKIIGIHHGMRT